MPGITGTVGHYTDGVSVNADTGFIRFDYDGFTAAVAERPVQSWYGSEERNIQQSEVILKHRDNFIDAGTL